MKRSALWICIFGLALCACEEEWTPDEGRFVETYVEILIANEQIEDPEERTKTAREIEADHGYPEGAFQRQFDALRQEPERLRRLVDSARSLARRISAEERARQDSSAT